MQISYKKIAWFMHVDSTTTLKSIFGKSRYKDIKHGLEMFSVYKEYSLGVSPLNISTLQEFSLLYQEEVSKKFNAKTYDIVSIYKEKLKKRENLMFGCIRKNGILVAGYIFSHKNLREKDTLAGAIKMARDERIGEAPLFYYLEYLFFDYGLKEGIQQFSAGKDRNCYGYLGESIGLVIHKLQNHYLPYPSSETTEFTLDTDSIQNDTLVFETNHSISFPCTVATLWTKNPPQELLDLLKKRNIETVIYHL